MNAKFVNNNDTQREKLGELVPLKMPFSAHVFPAYVCNFKCSYCLHSLSDEKLKEMSFKKEIMDYEVYKKIIDDIKKFPDKLKALVFAGHGEPLIHKRIADMVAYAKKQAIAERTEIVTNGYLLTPELSDRLIAAGLDRLRISIQGLSQEKYKQVAGIDINYVKFLENLKYFYENKTNTKVHIKIIDIGLESKAEEQKFYHCFGGICDEIAVEYLIPFASGVDYTALGNDFKKCKQGHQQFKTNICAMPFYMMVVEPDGSVVPCCSNIPPAKVGNIKESSLADIWHQDRLRQFQIMQLKGQGIKHPVCGTCTVPTHGMQHGDYLDDYAEELLGRLQKK
ncbi:MAG: radical SAM protein [Thermincolia bacterium]